MIARAIRHLVGRRLLKLGWRTFIEPFASRTAATRSLYWIELGRRLNLAHPRDFNEKLQWLKLNWPNPLISRCTDKWGVREYVAERGCADVLNDLYGVYDDAADIPWDELPAKFALKCTHGCGYNILCDEKAKLDRPAATARLRRWMRSTYGRRTAEYHYLPIRPRIICERFIEAPAGGLPDDYKVFCFDGRPRYVAVATDRATRVRWHFLDVQWNRIDIAQPEHTVGDPPAQPAGWGCIVEAAAALTQPFPFVRIDFYDDGGRAVFGEMTFLPSAGLNSIYYTQAGLDYAGGLLHLPEAWAEDGGHEPCRRPSPLQQ